MEQRYFQDCEDVFLVFLRPTVFLMTQLSFFVREIGDDLPSKLVCRDRQEDFDLEVMFFSVNRFVSKSGSLLAVSDSESSSSSISTAI